MGAGASVEGDEFEDVIPKPPPPLTESQKRGLEVDRKLAESEYNEQLYAKQVRELQKNLVHLNFEGMLERDKPRKQVKAVIEKESPRTKGDFNDSKPEAKYIKG